MTAAPTLEYHHCHRVRQVQAAAARAHWHPYPVFGAEMIEYSIRKTHSLCAEHKPVTWFDVAIGQCCLTAGAKGEHLCRRAARYPHQCRPVRMDSQRGVFVVVKAGAAQARIIERERERRDQVQIATGIGAQADDVAGIRRDFWLYKHDVKHPDSVDMAGAIGASRRACHDKCHHRNGTYGVKGACGGIERRSGSHDVID